MPEAKPMNECLETLLAVKDVARIFQVKKSWVYGRTRKRGVERLPHLKLGKYLRFEEGAIREFLERQKVSVRNS
jgi:predicted DNA-binding transcriptional regulator AlpA